MPQPLVFLNCATRLKSGTAVTNSVRAYLLTCPCAGTYTNRKTLRTLPVERHLSVLAAERQRALEVQRLDICLSAKWGELPTHMAALLQHPMGHLPCRVMEYLHPRRMAIRHPDHLIIQRHRDLLDPRVWQIVQQRFHNTAQLRAGGARDGCNQYGIRVFLPI